MGFEKTGTPSLVSKVASVCKCGSCSKEAMCVLKDGAYLCPDCLGSEPVAELLQDGQDGPQDGEPHVASVQDDGQDGQEEPHVAS